MAHVTSISAVERRPGRTQPAREAEIESRGSTSRRYDHGEPTLNKMSTQIALGVRRRRANGRCHDKPRHVCGSDRRRICEPTLAQFEGQNFDPLGGIATPSRVDTTRCQCREDLSPDLLGVDLRAERTERQVHAASLDTVANILVVEEDRASVGGGGLDSDVAPAVSNSGSKRRHNHPSCTQRRQGGVDAIVYRRVVSEALTLMLFGE